MLLVTTVSPGTAVSRPASAYVVVPADRAIALPGTTSAAAAWAIASLSAVSRSALASKPGS